MHAGPLGDPVAGCGNVEFAGSPPSCPDALLHVPCKLEEGLVSGVDIGPGIHNGDDRLPEILLPVTRPAHEPHVVGLGYLFRFSAPRHDSAPSGYSSIHMFRIARNWTRSSREFRPWSASRWPPQ
ncbi:hypothetical protein SDC9_81180 [bioreactor metagenome]|uniref:Uncharacterized protein n=1 Tax=bioreactor metagenome TaxID=1076179 RepID=A0A644Z9F8_9ZZZZ